MSITSVFFLNGNCLNIKFRYRVQCQINCIKEKYISLQNPILRQAHQTYMLIIRVWDSGRHFIINECTRIFTPIPFNAKIIIFIKIRFLFSLYLLIIRFLIFIINCIIFAIKIIDNKFR